MSNDNADIENGRRLFLKSIGALGVTAAVGSAAASAQESEGSLDGYHRTLRDELTDSGREQKQLPAGTYVYGTTESAALEAFSLEGGGTEESVPVDTDAVPITRGERLAVPGDASDPSDYVYRGAIPDHSFSEGDLLLGVAYVRSDADDAEATASFGYGGENFVRRGADIDPNGEWMRYFFPVEVGSVPSSDATPALEFHLGHGEQTIEFGGLALFDYGDADVSLGTLPPYDYEGRSEDAEWRDAAHRRIEEIRTRDIEVEVLNPGGQPMTRAAVDLRMVEHEFDFGSAVSAEHVTGESGDDETYRETFLENFNKAVVENGLKYPAWEGDWDIDNDATRATLDWLTERDVPARGHYLLWEQFDDSGGGGMSIENPESLSADEVRSTVTEKIRNHANEFEDGVAEWDMHNHPVWQSNFRDADGLGWDAAAEWWSAADESTDDELYTNEMGAVGGTWQQDQYYEYIEHLVENDYPVDGIGFMGHHQQQWNQMLDMETLIGAFDRFAEFGLPLLVTEFDIQIFDRRNAQDVEVQKDYLRDFLTVTFGNEAVEGVVSWGFWAEDHWRPTGAYYDTDWTLRAHGEQFRELVFGEWWTEESGYTDKDGRYLANGFKGTYEVTAEKGDLTGATTVAFDDENGSVTVQLSPPSDDEGSEGEQNGNANGGRSGGNDGQGTGGSGNGSGSESGNGSD